MKEDELDNKMLSDSVKSELIKQELPFKFKYLEEGEHNFERCITFKYGTRVRLDDDLESITSRLVEGLTKLLNKELKGEKFVDHFYAHVTKEFTVSGIMKESPNIHDKHISSYFTCTKYLNPPDTRAWVVMRGNFNSPIAEEEDIRSRFDNESIYEVRTVKEKVERYFQ